jgi:hypothetical protein
LATLTREKFRSFRRRELRRRMVQFLDSFPALWFYAARPLWRFAR